MGFLVERVKNWFNPSTFGDLNNPLFSGSVGSVDSLAGIEVNQGTTIGLPAVFCALQTISERFGMLPMILYKQTAEGKERAREHALYDVLRKMPNERQTAIEFRSAMMAQILLYGTAYAWIDWSARTGEVRQLIPFWAPYMTLVEGGAWSDVTYVYRAPGQPERKYQKYEVFKVSGFSPTGLQGLSPVMTCANSLGLSLAIQTYASKFFANGASMSGIISTPWDSEISQEAFDANGKVIDELYTGSVNAHKPKLLQGVTWLPLSVSPEAAQALETQRLAVIDVSRIFCIPPQILMSYENSNRATATEQNIAFKSMLVPWGERWTQRVDVSLLHRSERINGYFSGIVWAMLEQADLLTTVKALGEGKSKGFMSGNEVRERLDMNRMPGDQGDQYEWAVNKVPADKAGKILKDRDAEDGANADDEAASDSEANGEDEDNEDEN